MTRQLEQHLEERSKRRREEIVNTVEFGLAAALERNEARLVGFAVKDRGSDWLMTIKAVRDGEAVVSFVGSADLGSVLIKASRMARGGKLVWKKDIYAKERRLAADW